METALRILIVAKSGHFRDSMVAVLKTLPRVELFLVNGLNDREWENLPQATPTIALVDLETSDTSHLVRLTLLREKWPGLRCVALVDNFQQARAARSGNAELTLSRGASAGELLCVIQRISGTSPATIRYAPAYPTVSVMS